MKSILNKKDYEKYIYNPTKDLVSFVKSKKTPVICFPKGINDYKSYVSLVKPDVISIDYYVDPKKISENYKMKQNFDKTLCSIVIILPIR